MASKHYLLFFTLLLILLSVQAFSNSNNNNKPTKLFVFGDSYADTGNTRKSITNSWKFPYGITFPGKPSGRFSDGRVFTDFLAKFMGVKSPVPYKWRKYAPKKIKYGVNFAYGGTGVFDTFSPDPNMTTQIDFFQNMVTRKVYSSLDLKSSVALISLAGNDYSTYIANYGFNQGLQEFIPQVVNQLAQNMKRLNDIGVERIAVTALQPLGCLPRTTFMSSFQRCNSSQNQLVIFHNLLLQQAVSTLRNNSRPSNFVVLDLYSAFMAVLDNNAHHLGSARFSNPLKPCCIGISEEYSCGSVDEEGTKMYTVCDNPKASFFWDTVHPTQQGWASVYFALQPSLQRLYN